jgi:predicted nucleic acid-binding protein
MRRVIPIGYVIDTWVWVEYWTGNGEVREWIEDQSPLFTSTITFTEAVRYFITEERDPETIFACLNDIRVRCTVVPVDEAIAILAGHLKNREVQGIAESIILATARRGNHRVVTGDPHFKEIPDAVYLGQA